MPQPTSTNTAVNSRLLPVISTLSTICNTSPDLVDVPSLRDSAAALESLCSESDGDEPDLHSCNSHSDFENDGNPSTNDVTKLWGTFVHQSSTKRNFSGARPKGEIIQLRVFSRKRKPTEVTQPSPCTTQLFSHVDMVLCSGSANHLKAASLRTRSSDKGNTNRHSSCVFITRLAPRSTPNQVASQIRDVTGRDTRPEQLQTKYDSFCSFYIRCDERLKATLLAPTSWPTGVMVKPFYD